MKMLLPIMFIFIVACSTSTTNSKFTKIEFEKLNINLNTIKVKDSVEYNFEFTNVGDTILIIYKVKPSCGCTVPEWTKEAVKKGKRGIIKIKYSSAQPKEFSESILIYYNGKDSPITLHISGKAKQND